MEYCNKEYAQTSDSFKERVPLTQKHLEYHPTNSQIQELMVVFVQKKSQLKEAKIRHENLESKEKQQNVRIDKIKISFNHLVEKDQMLRIQNERMHQQVSASKVDVKQVHKCVEKAKQELTNCLEETIVLERAKTESEELCNELEYLINRKKEENIINDKKNQQLDTTINNKQNRVRSKQEDFAQLSIDKAELITLLDFLQQKLTTTTRAKNATQAQTAQINQIILKQEQKTHNINQQQNDVDWSCQKIKSQNSQIEELNSKLEFDLEDIKKHLITMQKMNLLLHNSINEFEMTGEKVARLINLSKN